MSATAIGAAAPVGTSRFEPGVRPNAHERLGSLGLRPVGRASEFGDDLHALMARTPVFGGLDADETRKLGTFMYVYEAPAGVTLIAEGDAGDFMLMLMSGTVDVLRRDPHQQRVRIALAHAGQALGEMSMFDGQPRFATCVTLEPCRFAVLTRDAMMLVMHDEPRLGGKVLLKLVQMMSDRLRQTSARLVGQAEAVRHA